MRFLRVIYVMGIAALIIALVVAGVAALVWRFNPLWTNDSLRTALQTIFGPRPRVR